MMHAIKNAKDNLISLAHKFRESVHVRDQAELIILSQAEAREKLRSISFSRGALLRIELREIGNTTRLSQERVSLLLRYRSSAHDPDGQISGNMIAQDLKYAAQADDFAGHILTSLGSYEPLAQDEQDHLKATLTTSLAETKRILDGCTGPVLSTEEVAAFHSIYDLPDDPLDAYRDKTERLTQSTLNLVEMTGKRVENTLTYVGIIDQVIVPAFPNHAEGMKAQANVMLQEAVGSFTRMNDLIQRAETYQGQLERPPVRGPQP